MKKRGRSSRLKVGSVGWKRFNDALDKHLKSTLPSKSSDFFAKEMKVKVVSSPTRIPIFLLDSDSDAQLCFVNEFFSTDSDVSADSLGTTWIGCFCNLQGNEFFCEVDKDYIRDDFNLCGLNYKVPYYKYALELILDIEYYRDEEFTEDEHKLVESSAKKLYGMIHARYILTDQGLFTMYQKFKHFEFGRCPRVLCAGQSCLPMGQSDIRKTGNVKLYCPKCENIFQPTSKHKTDLLNLSKGVDGSYFGTTFPHLFKMHYAKPRKPPKKYEARVFGFKIHKP